MLTNKDIRVENGNIVINGDKYPLEGQSPAAIMQIVEDNSDTTPTAESSAPVQSGGVYATVGDLTDTGVTGATVAAQLGTLNDLISGLRTVTPIWEGDATTVDTPYSMTANYTDYKYLLVLARTNVEIKVLIIPTASISATNIYSDVLSVGAWDTTTNAFTYNSSYGIKFTTANTFQIASLTYNNSNWIMRPRVIYGIG